MTAGLGSATQTQQKAIPIMQFHRKLLLGLVVAAATIGTTSSPTFATDEPVSPPPTTFEVKDGGAHCDATHGNHWAWDLRIIPGSQVVGTPTISSPWTVQNVTGPNANDRLIVHAVSTEPVFSQTYSLTVNGTPYDVTPTLHPSDKCPGTPPPPVPPTPTCETDSSLCPPPEPTCEELGTCPPPPVPTCETDESLCKPPPTPTPPVVPPSVSNPSSPPAGFAPSAVSSDVPVPPSSLELSTQRVTALPRTGVASTLIHTGLAFALLLTGGLLLLSVRKTQNPRRGLQR